MFKHTQVAIKINNLICKEKNFQKLILNNQYILFIDIYKIINLIEKNQINFNVIVFK